MPGFFMTTNPVPCEIIAIGNELLIGDVQDTNTHWLIQQLTGLGGCVRRCAIVRDEFPAIAEALQSAVAAETALIITSGGLGPTGDDLTLAAVAAAFHLPVAAHAEAMAMLEKRYGELARAGWVSSPELNDARKKMAMFPQGAEPIYNPVGGAPAALLRVRASTIVCLPGVPPELKSIFTTSMNPLLRSLFGGAAYQIRAVIVSCQDESFMASELQGVVERHPRVYIKSRAMRMGPGVRIKVTLSATGRSSSPSAAEGMDFGPAGSRLPVACVAVPGAPTVEALIGRAQDDLRKAMETLGLSCTEEEL
jgi:nicotinamide-nucleotide amidase